MYFLNGDRIYINPQKACGTIEEQLHDCLNQVAQINSGKKIFKLNFFVNTTSKNNFFKLQQKINKEVKSLFNTNVLQCVIAQPPLSCKIIVEVCFYDPQEWQVQFVGNENNGIALFRNETAEIVIGNVQSNSNSACKLNSENAFADLIDLFNQAKFPLNSIVRQWNYIEDILGFDGEKQRYQEFNDVRSGVYGNTFEERGYPAATGIGMNQGGVAIEFLAIKSLKLNTQPIDNPGQIAAHHYSKEVLIGDECIIKTTPKFERARFLEIFNKKLIFISGTASIIGERTVGVGDAVKQTEITIQNIEKLYSDEVLERIDKEHLKPRFSHARVYIKNRKDFSAIRKTFKNHFADLPVVYIIADICRNDLLVEIEGKVILE
jgi:hypothetical protein